MPTNYEFIDNGKSININFNNMEYTASKGDIELVVLDNVENKKLEIRSNTAQETDLIIDLNKDTVTGVGAGSTTATQLRDALEAIFFLDDNIATGGLAERVIVNQSNVSTTLGGTIDSTKEYFLDGVIDMGATQVTIPSTGINLTGYNFDASGLISSEDNYTMFNSGGSGVIYTNIVITSNDGAVNDGDLRGRSTGTPWGRIDINGFSNIRFSESFVIGETYSFEDNNGDIWEFELASIDHGTTTESFIELYPASEPTVNGSLGSGTENNLGTSFVDVEDTWDGSGGLVRKKTVDVIGSGNFIGKDYKIEVTGANSKVYDLTSATGFDAFEFSRINYNDCTSLGEINGYRQGLENGTGRFGGSPSLTLSGTWLGGYRVVTSIVRGISGTVTEPLFKAGTGFTMNSRFATDANIDLGTLQPLLDFSPSNFPNSNTLQLQDMIVTRDGALDAEDTNITPNVNASDLCSYWKRNTGLNNTYVGGTTSVVLEAATNITVIGQYEQLNAGAFLGSGLEHFTATADGRLQHDGVSPREFEITYNLNLESQANNELFIKFYKYDAKTTSEVALDYTIQGRQVNSFVGGRDIAFFGATIGATLDQGDQLFIKVMNNSSTQNITAEGFSFFRVQER